MKLEVRRTIPADHPSLSGHFPGTPIIPAVVILDEVNAALAEHRQDWRLSGIARAKFLAPLKPDQPFTISISGDNNVAGEIDFCCHVDEGVIVEGKLQVESLRPLNL